MPRRASKKVELLEEIPGSATTGEVEVVESIENRDEEYEAVGVLPLRKFFKRAPPGEEPPNIATCNGKLLTVDASTDSKDGENLLFLPQKGPFLLVAELDMEADDGGINRRAVAKNGGETGFQAIIVQYAIGMDPEPQLWARDIHNRAWMLVEPTTEYKQMFDKAIQAATLVYGVLDLEDEFAEKRKVLEVKEVLFQYAMRTGSGLSRTAMEKLFASHAEEMITHCLGDDVTKGRAIVKFLKETFPDEFRRIHSLCNIHKKPMAKTIKDLETEADGDDEEEVEDPAVVPSVFYPPDHIMELAVNAKAMKKAENANLPCMPTPVVIYTYIVIHGISNCPTILYRDWSIARPETARYMVIYWAPKILEFMTDQTSEAYVELKALSQVCKPKDRADALAWVKRNNPGHERGRLGHDSEVTSEQRKRIPKPEWLQEGIAYDVIIHRQKPVDLWENFIFLQVRVPPEHRIRSAKKIVPKEDAARGPAFSSPTDEDVVMEDAAPDSAEVGIISRSREPSPAPGAEEKMPLANVALNTNSSQKPAGKTAALKPSAKKDIREREITRKGDGLVNEHGKKKPLGRPPTREKSSTQARKAATRKTLTGPSAPAMSSQSPLPVFQPPSADYQLSIADDESPIQGFLSGTENSRSFSFGSSRPFWASEFTRLCSEYHPTQANSPPALDSSSSTTTSPSPSPPPNAIVANQITADRLNLRVLPDGSYNCTREKCAFLEREPKSFEGYQRMLDHNSMHVGHQVGLVQGEEMRTGRPTGFLQQKLKDALDPKLPRTVPVKPIRRDDLF